MIVKGIPCCCVWARLNASLIVLESGKEIDGNIDVCGMWANLLLPLEMLLVAAVAMLPLSLAAETMRRRCNLNKCPATENIEHNCLLLCFVLPCLVGFFSLCLVSSALVASFPFQHEGQRPQKQLQRSLATSNIGNIGNIANNGQVGHVGGTAATPATPATTAFGAAAYKSCEFRSLSP